MNLRRKLQVFVSSTYTDLIKERQAAVEAILLAGHIPAGMELFSAGDKSQMEVIKRWIDESDVYLLLLGGRYGSIDPESGKSYTQLEYEYALETGKPLFALVIEEEQLEKKIRNEGSKVVELDQPNKLKDFKAQVKTKIVKFWNDERDIKLAILQKLLEFNSSSDLIGWIPGNEAINSNIIAKEVARLTRENASLKSKEVIKLSLNEAFEQLEHKKNLKGPVGIPSGFANLDQLISGWQPGELIVLAGRPGMGKSSFALSALRNPAVDFGIPVALFTLEASNEQIVNRLIASETQIDLEKIQRGNLQPFEWQNLHSKTNFLMNAPIFIDDTSSLHISDLTVKCLQLKLQHNIQLAVIDYLQLIIGEKGKDYTREQELDSILRALKALAKELNIPIIVLSQLSPNNDKRFADWTPQLSDLSKSPFIEENADKVIFIHRPESYGIVTDEAGNSPFGIAYMTIAKNRNGALDTVSLRFMGRYTKFTDLYDA